MRGPVLGNLENPAVTGPHRENSPMLRADITPAREFPISIANEPAVCWRRNSTSSQGLRSRSRAASATGPGERPRCRWRNAAEGKGLFQNCGRGARSAMPRVARHLAAGEPGGRRQDPSWRWRLEHQTRDAA